MSIMQKGFSGILLVIIGAIAILVFCYVFIITPYKVFGSDVKPPFKLHQTVLAEKLTYLFKNPEVGERVVFNPQTSDGVFVGTVKEINTKGNVASYKILAAAYTQGNLWEISKEKIKGRVYYPFLSKKEVIALLPTFTPASTTAPAPTKGNKEWDTSATSSDLQLYKNLKYGFSINYPNYLVIDSASSSKIASFLQKQDDLMAQRLLLQVDERLSLEEAIRNNGFASSKAEHLKLDLDGHNALALVKKTSLQNECNIPDTTALTRHEIIAIQGSNFVITLIPNDSCETMKKDWFSAIFPSLKFGE